MPDQNDFDQLQKRVEQLENRVKFLEAHCNIQAALSEPAQAKVNNREEITNTGETGPRFYGQGVKPRHSEYPVHDEPHKKTKSIDIEEIVGKYLVGAIASLLVFIAAVCLVAVFWNLISDEVRFAIILLFGLGLAVFAYLRMWKIKRAIVPWSVALGTGVGLVYIALIAGYVSFYLFGQVAAAIMMTGWSVLLTISYKPVKSFFVIVIAYLGSLVGFIFILSIADGIGSVTVGAMMGIVLSAVMMFISRTQLQGIHQLVSAVLCSLYPIILAVRMSSLRNINDIEELACNLFCTVFIYGVTVYVRHVAEDFKAARLCKNILSEIGLCIGAVFVITALKSTAMFADYVNLSSRVLITVMIFLSIFIATFKISNASTVILGVYLTYTFGYFTGYNAGLGIMSLLAWGIGTVHKLIAHRVHGQVYFISKSKQIIIIAMVTVGCLVGLGVDHDRGGAVNIDKTDVSGELVTANEYKSDIYRDDSFLDVNRTNIKYMAVYTVEMICIILSSLLLTAVKRKQGGRNWIEAVKAWSYCISWLTLLWLTMFLVPRVMLINPIEYPYVLYLKWKPVVAMISAFIFNIVLYCKGYFKDWNVESKDWQVTAKSGVALTVSNIVLYISGLWILAEVDTWQEHLVITLVLTAIVLKQSYVLTYNFRNNPAWRRSEPLTSLCLGLKYITFIWAVASSFNIGFGNIIVSIASMFASFILIYSGFKIKMKTMRIYGLTVIILMTLKIALWDLSASGGLVRIAALGIGGMICLGVSIVYSNWNKQDKLS